MYLFLSTFLFLYALLHFYFFVRLKSNIPTPFYLNVLILILLIILIFSPILVRVLERLEFFTYARILAYIGYTWMAFIFLFFCISPLFLVVKKFLYIPRFNDFYISLAIVILLIIYGTFEAKNITVKNVKIHTPKLRKGEIFKIVQISDVHLGIILRDKFLEKIINKIKEINPDILVSTGDLVDGQANDILHLTSYFRSISPPSGKFAILGNHEFYVGVDNSISFLEKAGFTVLRNKNFRVKDNIVIAGIDDDTVNRYGGSYVDELSILKNLDADDFVLFLKHKPKVNRDALKFFDLQLSGHTHNGQIFPFTFIVKIFFPLKSGLTSFNSADKTIYVYNSKGTGTWGPPIRVLAKPEITVIELIGKK